MERKEILARCAPLSLLMTHLGYRVAPTISGSDFQPSSPEPTTVGSGQRCWVRVEGMTFDPNA